MTDTAVLLSAVSANGTGAIFDAGDLKDEVTLEVVISGTVSAYSVQLQGSIDGTNWLNLGTPDTSSHGPGSAIGPVTASTDPIAISAGILCRYFRAALATYSGTGTVTAQISCGAAG